MDRWDELERLGKLRAEGLLSEEEFEAQKRRVLEADSAKRADPLTEPVAVDVASARNGNWLKITLVGGAVILAALLMWVFSSSLLTKGNSPRTVVANTNAVDVNASSQPTTYGLRSNVTGASLVRFGELPTVAPYGDNSDDYCGERVRSATKGGQLAEQRGWRVVKEAKFHGLDAVLLVRGYDPGTSGHCTSKDPNLMFFDGSRLVGVLFSKGKNGIGMNSIENVGGNLRVWDDMSAVGQVSLSGTDLTFDRVTGSDSVCDGKYRVPVVFGQPYSKARRILGSSGWIARTSKEETSAGDRTETYRTRFPEVDSCSGTGYGYCTFGLTAKEGAAKLSIITAGEDDDPSVTSYDVSCDSRHGN